LSFYDFIAVTLICLVLFYIIQMKAVVLAGGRGTRLRPLTDNIPKPMVSLRGVPLLEYTLSILPKQIDQVVIVVGYMSDRIKNYFGRGFGGRSIEYVLQIEPKGTFHALKQAEDKLAGEDFLIVSGDDVYSAKDLHKVASARHMSVLTNKTSQPERFGICKLNNEGFLESIVEKPKEFCGDLANIGVYKINHSIFKQPVILGSNGEELLAPMIGSLALNEKIEVITASFWHPIADMEDWQKAQQILI
jgi:NDP-sugar pyrophosphorylase family protein